MASLTVHLLTLCVLVGGSLGQRPAPCNTDNFNTCANALADKLAVAQGNVFKEMFLYDGLYNLFTRSKGVSDVVNICNSLTNFYACVNAEQLRACMSPLGWVSQGYSPSQAYLDDGTFRMWDFVCGAGFQLMWDNPSYTCIRTTWANNYAALVNGSLKAYQKNVAYDPVNACTYTAQLQDAWANVFANQTCHSVFREHAGNFFGCASQLEYTSTQFRHCTHTHSCTWAASWSGANNFVKAIDGVNHLRIPPYWEKDADDNYFQTEEQWIQLH